MKLTHIDDKGNAIMVDIGDKPISSRRAIAKASIYMKEQTLKAIKDGAIKKGDVLSVSRVAGIMAAKKVSELIPLCHNLNLSSVSLDFKIVDEEKKIDIEATVKCVGQTGVEMEALTAVSVAALTIYDMCKAIDKEMLITNIMLLEKSGGTSGDFKRL
ncbi:MAG: cyclic pyranopterin monophosphate synthase MoaC [Thermodesulfovibrionales bacterium]|nr:cyclic pyranopterin monophosphate synthase MoaC [Thermodesulfovibrionales bacterium]